MQQNTTNTQVGLVRGDFVSDGENFVFRLADTPFSGTGRTAGEAFEDLMRATAAAGGLGARLKELAREQHGELLRSTIVRSAMAALVVLGIVGGALGVSAALAPKVAADMMEVSADRLGSWLRDMPEDERGRLTSTIRDLIAVDCSGAVTNVPVGRE